MPVEYPTTREQSTIIDSKPVIIDIPTIPIISKLGVSNIGIDRAYIDFSISEPATATVILKSGWADIRTIDIPATTYKYLEIVGLYPGSYYTIKVKVGDSSESINFTTLSNDSPIQNQYYGGYGGGYYFTYIPSPIPVVTTFWEGQLPINIEY